MDNKIDGDLAERWVTEPSWMAYCLKNVHSEEYKQRIRRAMPTELQPLSSYEEIIDFLKNRKKEKPIITNERLLELAVLRDDSPQTEPITLKQLKRDVERVLPVWIDNWSAFRIILHRYKRLNPDAPMEELDDFSQTLLKILNIS